MFFYSGLPYDAFSFLQEKEMFRNKPKPQISDQDPDFFLNTLKLGSACPRTTVGTVFSFLK